MSVGNRELPVTTRLCEFLASTNLEDIVAPAVPAHELDELGPLIRTKLRLYAEGIRTDSWLNAILAAVDGIEDLGNVATLEELVFH